MNQYEIQLSFESMCVFMDLVLSEAILVYLCWPCFVVGQPGWNPFVCIHQWQVLVYGDVVFSCYQLIMGDAECVLLDCVMFWSC